jgi:hypothetical protein
LEQQAVNITITIAADTSVADAIIMPEVLRLQIAIAVSPTIIDHLITPQSCNSTLYLNINE